MNTEKTIKVIFLLSVLPLLGALVLTLYFKFNLSDLTHITFKFARLNAYIYAHAYGAILLAVFCGIRLGQLSQLQQSGWLIGLHFMLFVSAWLSYKSFADWQGMSFLIFCWLFYTFLFIHSSKQVNTPKWFYNSSLSVQISNIVLLSLITLINQ